MQHYAVSELLQDRWQIDFLDTISHKVSIFNKSLEARR
jgi:hypothetical protein